MIDKKMIIIISSAIVLFIFILIIFNPLPVTHKLYCKKYYEDETYEIFLMNPDGSSGGTLFMGNAQEIYPSLLWTPQSPKFIYYVYEITEDEDYFWKIIWKELYVEKNQIWLMNLDGSEEKLLMEDYWLNDLSKDREKLLLIKKDDSDLEIWIMNWDGTDFKQLTDNDVIDKFPQFALDEQKIIYMSGFKITQPYEYEGTWEIWIMNIDGSEKKRISMESRYSYPFRVSPDGEKIAYQEVIDFSSIMGLYVIKLDDFEKSLIEKFEIVDFTWFAWSPSSNYIVYCLENEIWISSIDGKEKRKILEIERKEEYPISIYPSIDYLFYSPNESKIYYLSIPDIEGDFETWVVNIDGSENKRLSDADIYTHCSYIIPYKQYLEIRFHQNLRFIKLFTIFGGLIIFIIAILLIWKWRKNNDQ